MLNIDYLNLNFCTFHIPKFEHDANLKKIFLLPSSGTQGDHGVLVYTQAYMYRQLYIPENTSDL